MAVLSATFIAIASGEIIGTADGKIFIRARNESLRSVVAIFHKDFAFEFAGEKLKIVIIVPGAKRSISSPVDSDTDSTKREEIVSVAVINSVVESSQAESLDLLQGDFIVEYDGIRINSASQLVKEVEKRSVKNQIEMLVVRDKTPMRLIIQGGFIGVRITTEKISKPEYLNYF